MSNYKSATKIILAVIGVLTTVLQSEAVRSLIVSAINNFGHAHPQLSAIFVGLASVIALLYKPHN